MRGRLIWVVAATMLVAIGSVCLSTFADDDESATTGIVIGKIVDPAGKPAADVIVTLGPNGEKMRLPFDTASDSEGKFKIEKVPEGDYNLNARTRDTKFRAIKSLSVLAGRTKDIGTLKLKPKK